MAARPLVFDCFCGLGGWAEGCLAEGYDVIGFDIERRPYPGHLVLQDVMTIHGSQFRDAVVIVASPPCQEFSYMAMPWKRAKQIARALRGQDEFPAGYTGSRTIEQLTALFDACFRIQREASEAAGRHIPLVVENVVGAQAWVGPARWHHGSFYLWGDVPALMPLTLTRLLKQPGRNFHFPEKYGIPSPSFHGAAHEASVVRAEGVKVASESGRRTDPGNGVRFTSRDCGIEGRGIHTGVAEIGRDDGTKQGGEWWHDTNSITRRTGSKSPARKAASAQIAKIPFALANWIARVYKPAQEKSA